MNWLAFDTSTDVLSVAVSRADQVWAHDSAGGAQASADGLPTVLRLMQEAALTWPDLQAIVMGRGPGAFTGLRTACAMAQGLAWGANLQVLPIDTLLAVAETAHHAHPAQAHRDRLLVVMDARMSQVYVAAYARETSPHANAATPTSAAWQCVLPPTLCAPSQVVPPETWVDAGFCVAGNAQSVYAGQWPEALQHATWLQALPSAQALLRLAPQAWAQGLAVAPEHALPFYVRDKVAQTTAEREAQKEAQKEAQHEAQQEAQRNAKSAASTPELRLQPLRESDLDAVIAIEQQSYSHPWTRGNFADSMKTGYHMRALMGGDTMVGYYVAMLGVQEVHLLNITVAPAFQKQGHGRMLLDAMHVWARQQQAQCAWLEVRQSNARAIQVYERYGYKRVGLRKAYYPDHNGRREDAVVMSYPL